MLSKISVLFLRSRNFCLLPSSITVEPVPPGLQALISSTQIVLPPTNNFLDILFSMGGMAHALGGSEV